MPRSKFMNRNDEFKKYSIGDFTYGFPKIYDWDDGTMLSIGKFCSIADQVTILLGGNHRMDWTSTFPFMSFANEFPSASSIKGHPASKGSIQIGNDVWVGFGATILSGVTIGDGACIGAQTVVSKNVAPYEIVAGNPATSLGFRFPPEQIKKLIDTQWWDWDLEEIKKQIPSLLSNPVDSFLEDNKA